MSDFEIQLLETIILAVIVLGVKLFSRSSINRLLNKMDFDLKRKQISHRVINLFLTIFVVTVLAGIWNIHKDQLIVFLTSVVTVLGIAFFAQWSILSNITSSLILFFHHPMKIGQHIKVVDKEYDLEGELIDISFFFLYIKSEKGDLITIPNTVVLQKSIITKI